MSGRDDAGVEAIEALVGYTFIVGGRVVSTAPPGGIVELPPRKAVRGREGDTFFALITPQARPQGTANLYEELAHLAADVYFRGGGGVTSGLREAINAVNSQALESGQIGGLRLSLNMICAVMRANEVYLARAAGGMCVLRQSDTLTRYPDTPEVGVAPIGTVPSVEIRLSRCEVAPGDVMVLSDTGLSAVDSSKLNAALRDDTLPTILAHFKDFGLRELQAMVIHFAAPDTPNPVSPPTRKSTPIATPQKKATQSTPAPAPLAADMKISPSTSALPNAPAAPEGTAEPELPAPLAPEPIAAPEGHVVEISPAPTFAPRKPLPQTGPSEPKAPISQRAALSIGNALGAAAEGLHRAIDRTMPPDELLITDLEDAPKTLPTPRIPTMLAAGLAILVPVVIVFIVVALQLSQFDLTQFEQMVREVEEAAQQAERIPMEDEQTARTAWLAVLQRVDLVETSSGRNDDPTLARIRAKARSVLDTFDKVTRRTPTPLRSYGENALLNGPVVRGGSDVYVLDTTRDAIYRDTLNDETKTLVTRNTQAVVQRGQSVSAFSVRDIVDITWMSEGGIQRANVLAALDTQGILITYSPTFSPATAQRLPGIDLWGKIVAMQAWRGNLYLLDAGNGQIWRYRPAGNTYPNPPEAYFDEETKPDLTDAVDFGIDSAGNVYILFSDGQILKFNTAVEQRFSFTGLPAPLGLKSGTSMYLDSDSPLPAIWIVDAADQSIYQVTLSGNFRFRFRAENSEMFNQLTTIYAERDDVYVSAGNTLYYFSIADLNAR
ncbi:MAG: hypothetical protein OHK0023_28230 [Anaerolineae bacterium]